MLNTVSETQQQVYPWSDHNEISQNCHSEYWCSYIVNYGFVQRY